MPLPESAVPAREIVSVSALVRQARGLLEANLPMLWIEGEISNLARPASGHVYFTLKDEYAQVRCAMFRTRALLVREAYANGQQVLVRARVTLYEARGEFQLVVESVEPAGEGRLRRAFEALRARLAAEGLFEPALVLTPPDGATNSAEDDGLLTASEAAGLKLGARWVILSACNTGAGLEAGAGGYSGLARGFLQAGAQSLLVSLWPLRDDAAARLTVDTVRFHARGVSQAEALRRAQLRLIGDRTLPDAANPAIWAPFSLVTL